MSLKSILRWAVLKLLWAPLYRLGRLRRLDPRLVLFASELDPQVSDNLRPLMARLTQEGYDCRFFSVTRELPRRRRHMRSMQFIWAYARARATFLVDSFSPVNVCKPRPGAAVVQLWHGCGAFKKIGYSTRDAAWGPSRRQLRLLPMHRNYTHICASAPDILPQLADAYACHPAILVPWGVPRADFYFSPTNIARSKEEVLAAFPEIGSRKIVLYAPTFRGDSAGEARHDGALDYGALSDALEAGCALLLKPHPRASTHIPKPPQGLPPPERDPFVFDAAGLPVETLLCAADLLVTDYSSLVFEYSLLGRPMLFYPYDLEDYDRSRSFYFPYLRFVPGDLAWSSGDIAAAVRRNLFEGQFDPARVEAFRERFMSACDGHSTERILHNIFGI
ncbi:MAG: CDP-glycerol glycerophosphotransferase family protein [Oscillospiraceae bacterium]|jgi:CDP-ribitol ribitolphosphotransferase|nr:CDP-glycerol glycerophosphotransferase family protein [Oscillospiraceae bacterium]